VALVDVVPLGVGRSGDGGSDALSRGIGHDGLRSRAGSIGEVGKVWRMRSRVSVMMLSPRAAVWRNCRNSGGRSEKKGAAELTRIGARDRLLGSLAASKGVLEEGGHDWGGFDGG
jgi:hypothetical protein